MVHHFCAVISLTGFHGQDCSGDVDDPPPSVCSSYGAIVTGSEIECSENFDCCLCETISCGTRSKPCDTFSCNGDSSCFGLGDVRIYGSSSDGASIVCNGDESCNSTVITGQNIAEVECSGDGSCARAHFEFNCLSSEPCTIGCGGDWACAGTPPESDAATTHFAITNTAGIECSFEGCQYGTFLLTKNKGGGMILCSGYHSCYGSTIEINNIEGIICGGSAACSGAHFVVTDPQKGFEVECAGLVCSELMECALRCSV